MSKTVQLATISFKIVKRALTGLSPSESRGRGSKVNIWCSCMVQVYAASLLNTDIILSS